MIEFSGWLLDLYEDQERGLVLWFIREDEERICLSQPFPVTFYAAGPSSRLRALWRWLSHLPVPPHLERQERRDLFLPAPIPVLAIRLEKPGELRKLFHDTEEAFPDLTYYDADIQVQLRHAALFNTFPLAFCRVAADDQGVIREMEALTSRWEIDSDPVPLRVMEISLDNDPNRRAPGSMTVRFRTNTYHLQLLAGETNAYWIKTLLKRHDPDILLTDFGDSWLLDHLLESVGRDPEKLPLCRDPAHPPLHIKAKSYFSYGQIVFRNQQVHLYGRVHIDRKNAMMWSDGLEGILENACVTALPIQTAARVSPGTGISSMQMITAFQTGILVPWHKQQVEQPKSMLDLVHADFGGLIYQPTIGLHRDVAEIDFTSLYPAVMVRCDISPEKQPRTLSEPAADEPGLVPLTLAPLLQKRIQLKQAIPTLPAWEPRRRSSKARSAAIKWLLVV
jgi:DNA polymerase-2